MYLTTVKKLLNSLTTYSDNTAIGIMTKNGGYVIIKNISTIHGEDGHIAMVLLNPTTPITTEE